jgi:hypothetical protein
MRHHRITRSTALGLALAALAAPTAAAQQQDLRSPDTRDAARAAATAAGQQQDLRSPDTRDAARTTQTRQDLRSPDARDAAAGRGTFNAPGVTVVRLPQPAVARDGGIDWGDAGIGAGGLLTVILLATAGTFAVMRHRRGARAPMATTA